MCNLLLLLLLLFSNFDVIYHDHCMRYISPNQICGKVLVINIVTAHNEKL